MRRLASVLSIKRDKSDPPSTNGPPMSSSLKSRSGFFSKAPKTHISTDSARSTMVTASSSSSEGSASLRTPEDEALTLPKTEKKRWTPWLGSKKNLAKLPEIHAATLHTRDMGRSASILSSQRPPPLPTAVQDDTESDESDSSSESEEAPPLRVQRISIKFDSSVAIRSQTNFSALTRNSLIPPPSPPPLVAIPSSPLFPRSSNLSRTLSSSPTAESLMHRQALLRRLERKDLSRLEELSIAAYASRPKPALKQRTLRRTDDDSIASDTMTVGLLSRGLRRWATRPCFEERAVVWSKDSGGSFIWRAVELSRRDLAVAVIELSEGVESLAGLGFDDRDFEEALQASTKSCSPKQPAPLPRKTKSRTVTFKAVPSPLRTEYGPNKSSSPSAKLSFSSTPPASSSVPGARAKGVPADSREVRFADRAIDKEDDVPLGYTVDIKKRQQDKEKLLRAERERRLREEENRRAQEAEQKRREEEARVREEERRIREERQRTKFAEEVQAARFRREMQRSGSDNFTSDKVMTARGRETTYTRPAYDASHSPLSSSSDTSRSNQSRSPVGSRPGSFVESPSGSRRSSGIQTGPSSYHSSSEDVRAPHKDRRRSLTSEAASEQYLFVPDTNFARSTLPRSYTTPYVGAMYPTYPYAVPPVPPLPWDMPLLPPTPAFMMQQYPRQSSASLKSRESSRSRNSVNLNTNSSRESVHSRHSASGHSPRPQQTRAATVDSASRHQHLTSGGGSPHHTSRAILTSQPTHQATWAPTPNAPKHSSSTYVDNKRRTSAL